MEQFEDPVDGTVWSVDVEFLASNWRCIWGDGCEGILDEPAAELQQGCCSLGAELLDDDEARTIAALAAMLDPDHFQFSAEAERDGIFAERGATPDIGTGTGTSPTLHTRRVDGACIFLNRPGFAGGAGCALHLDAVKSGESPLDHKPSVCWQLPLKVERPEPGKAVLRRWQRHDWGPGGADMAWCCTEQNEVGTTAFQGDETTVDALADELIGLVGPDVAVAIRGRLAT